MVRFATVDQEYSVTDRRAFLHTLWQYLQLPEEQFEAVCPKGYKPPQQPQQDMGIPAGSEDNFG